jgi:hypothetical protein
MSVGVISNLEQITVADALMELEAVVSGDEDPEANGFKNNRNAATALGALYRDTQPLKQTTEPVQCLPRRFSSKGPPGTASKSLPGMDRSKHTLPLEQQTGPCKTQSQEPQWGITADSKRKRTRKRVDSQRENDV